MSITLNQLKQIASRAWTYCWENIYEEQTVEVLIDGDKKTILKILNSLADKFNATNKDYFCSVEPYDENGYEFKVEACDRETPDFDLDDDLTESNIVAQSAKLCYYGSSDPLAQGWPDLGVQGASEN